MDLTLSQLKIDLEQLADAKQATVLQRFFKTGKGQYGQGDIFLGINVPTQRQLAKKYLGLPAADVAKLLQSKIHEHRLTALLIWTLRFQKADPREQKAIYKLYLKHRNFINNWDLVDLSAPNIVGSFLLNNDRAILYKLAQSKNLWDKRIAILATFEFIRHGQADDTFKIAEILLNDNHDLIHKAVGWMLREVGKRIGQSTEEAFLNKPYWKAGTGTTRPAAATLPVPVFRLMPRTMLRYSIERFSPALKKKYMVK
jgi:3-methyladenine DNA glycosylase AlkD